MRHFVIIDIDNPSSPEIILMVNGKESIMSYSELKKLALDCEWAINSIENVQRTHKVMRYVENAY